MKLGELFKERRLAKEFTQKQVADILGVAPQYVSDIECCRRTVASFKRVLIWATYLGIGIHDLMVTEDIYD